MRPPADGARSIAVRSDVRETQEGVTFALAITVLDVTTCQPVANAAVDIWNANALGVYSDEASENTVGHGRRVERRLYSGRRPCMGAPEERGDLMRVLRSILAGALAVALVVLMMPVLPAAARSCEAQCQSDYEDAAAVCGKMKDQGDRKSCQDSAYASYKSCRANCHRNNGDGLERCKKSCDTIHDICHKRCNNRDPTEKCHADCTRDYKNCLRDCDKDYK